MPRSLTAPHDAIAVFVADGDPSRTVKYPFHEGADIPHTIDKDGVTFSLRSVMYEGKVAA